MCEISIVVPVYNKEKFIADTVNCILNQSYKNYELILIDDGSDDDSGMICDEFARNDKRIRIFHTKNQGVSSARNLGIKHATGTYICFLDADDVLHSKYLEKLYDAIKDEKADVAICDYYEISGKSKRRHGLRPGLTQEPLFEIIRYDLLCVVWNKLFIREKIHHNFNETISTCEDSIFGIDYYLDNQAKIAWVNEPLYEYKSRPDSITDSFQANSMKGIEALFCANRKLISHVSDNHLKKLAFHHACKSYFWGIYTYIYENLSKNPFDQAARMKIKVIINHRSYRKRLWFLLKYAILEKETESVTKKEFMYMLFSFFKMEMGIYLTAKLKTRFKR